MEHSFALEPLERRRLLSAGGLDLFFGQDGIAAVGDDVVPFQVTVDPQDRLLVLGAVVVGKSSDNNLDLYHEVLIRLLRDGRPDPAFGNNPAAPGRVMTDLAPYTAGGSAGALALAPDGKIVLLAPGWVARFSTDGTPDTAFGTGGRAAIAQGITATNLGVQSDGRIIVLGPKRLERFTAAGEPDPSFDGDAAFSAIDPGSSSDGSHGADLVNLKILPDDRMVVGGDAFYTYGSIDEMGNPETDEVDEPRIARLHSDGSVDTTFGDNGAATFFPVYASGFDGGLDVLPDGSVAFGFDGEFLTDPFDPYAVGLGRMTSSGTADSGFGGGGGWTVVSDAGKHIVPSPILFQPDGKIIAAGSATDSIGSSLPPFALARLNADGTRDAAFGSGGATTIGDASAGGFTGITDGAITRDGSIVVLGVRDKQVQLARYWGSDAPAAELTLKRGQRYPTAGASTFRFAVTYRDDTGIDLSTLDDLDVRVDFPDGSKHRARVHSHQVAADGQVHVLYKVSAPGGSWDAADNGSYRIRVRAGQVGDKNGHLMPQLTLGKFHVNLPVFGMPIHRRRLDEIDQPLITDT
jgi:uncharacterized delta-60 repeat protein